jgi:hypothetical protein
VVMYIPLWRRWADCTTSHWGTACAGISRTQMVLFAPVDKTFIRNMPISLTKLFYTPGHIPFVQDNRIGI